MVSWVPIDWKVKKFWQYFLWHSNLHEYIETPANKQPTMMDDVANGNPPPIIYTLLSSSQATATSGKKWYPNFFIFTSFATCPFPGSSSIVQLAIKSSNGWHNNHDPPSPLLSSILTTQHLTPTSIQWYLLDLVLHRLYESACTNAHVHFPFCTMSMWKSQSTNVYIHPLIQSYCFPIILCLQALPSFNRVILQSMIFICYL